MKYTHLDGGTYYRHMPSGRLLTPDDVTQPRIRECLERLLDLTFSTLEEQNLLADLPKDVEIVAEHMDPEVPEVFYLVSQSSKQVLNLAYDCPCPNPTHRREECPSPKLSKFRPYQPVVRLLLIDSLLRVRVREDAGDTLLEASRLVPYAYYSVTSTL
jgi:hypothetical protein